MFEDIERQIQGGMVINRDAGDRAVVFAIWSKNAVGHLPVTEAWQILATRYPSEPRFPLLHAYAELLHKPHGWTVTRFLDDVQKALDAAGGRLHPEVRDLLATAEDDLHQLAEADAARLDRIRSRVGTRTGDSAAAKKRLGRVALDFVRELHDKTEGGKSLGGGGGGADWKGAVAEAKGAKKPYSATEKVAVGDLLEHPKFGLGVVIGVDPGRANILFESGARKLVVG